MFRKITVILPIFLLLAAMALPAAAAQQKIGYANLQKALNESKAGEDAKEQLQVEAKELEKELDARQEELKKLKEEIDKKSAVWNKETLSDKEEALYKKGQEFQKQFDEYNKRLNKKKQDKEEEIIRKLTDVLEEIAKEKGYTFVFERSVGGLIYALPEHDLTDEVIKRFDKLYKEQKK